MGVVEDAADLTKLVQLIGDGVVQLLAQLLDLFLGSPAAANLIAQSPADHEAEGGEDQHPEQDSGVSFGHATFSRACWWSTRWTVERPGAGQLAETLAALAIPEDGGAIEVERRPSDTLALEPGAAHAGAHSLDDQVAFQFSDRADNDDDGAAQRAASVDLFAERHELDVETVQLVENL